MTTPRVRQTASRAREAASPTTLRTPRAASTSAPARSAATRSPASAVGEQRIYHVTHIDNLADILSSGALLADASDAWGTRPTVDISSADNREARRAAVVPAADTSVAGYVPFFLSPDSSLWEGIRSHEVDPRLSPEAHDSATFDFVLLVSTVGTARDGQAEAAESTLALTDGDAAGSRTHFGTTRETSERMLQKLRADQVPEAILQAEFLVKEAFPFEQVSLIGVANDKVRDVVRGILASSGFRPKVAVYPPWFQPAAASTL